MLRCLWREKSWTIAAALVSMRCPMSVSRVCPAGACAGAHCPAGGGLGQHGDNTDRANRRGARWATTTSAQQQAKRACIRKSTPTSVYFLQCPTSRHPLFT